MAEFIKSEKGKDKLVYEGHTFHHNGNNKSETRWRCDRYFGNFACKATVKTTLACLGSAEPEIVENSFKGRHSHLPDEGAVDRAKFTASIKEKAVNTREGTAQIVNSFLPALPLSSQASGPMAKNAARIIQKVRRQNCPKEPNTIGELKIPDKNKVTTDGSQFLLYDSADAVDVEKDSEEEGRRLMVFSTPKNLEYLAGTSTMYLDGTFSIVPSIFKQFYVVMGIVFGVTVALAYALSTHKDTECYEELFNVLVAEMGGLELEIKIKRAVLDFELGVVRALRSTWPYTLDITFCHFHLCQSLFRKLQKVGLQSEFCKNKDLRDQFTLLTCIAFLPPGKMEQGFEIVYGLLSDEMKAVGDHLDFNYLRGKPIRQGRGGVIRKQPLFKKEDWSCFNEIRSGESKTNNCLEAYNNRLRNLFPTHGSIFTFMDRLLEENRANEGKIANAMAGKKSAPNSSSVHMAKCLQEIAIDLENRSLLEFLEGCAMNISISKLLHVTPDITNSDSE